MSKKNGTNSNGFKKQPGHKVLEQALRAIIRPNVPLTVLKSDHIMGLIAEALVQLQVRTHDFIPEKDRENICVLVVRASVRMDEVTGIGAWAPQSVEFLISQLGGDAEQLEALVAKYAPLWHYTYQEACDCGSILCIRKEARHMVTTETYGSSILDLLRGRGEGLTGLLGNLFGFDDTEDNQRDILSFPNAADADCEEESHVGEG